ncbi:MAG TPA: FAD-dependent oxidoreductase [Caulobacteraceae bacterium]|nr:FAD-dependent oxidoreductase [Caulobacteraceae bacterium]
MTASLALGFDLAFTDLYDRGGLAKVDQAFLGYLGARDAVLLERLEAARAAPGELAGDPESELLIALAPVLEDFIGVLFGVEAELGAARQARVDLAPIFEVKRQFVQRRAVRKHAAEAASLDGAALRAALEPLLGGPLTELAYAKAVEHWLADEAANAEALELAARYAAWATLSEPGRAAHHHGVLFKAPGKVDPLALVPVIDDPVAGIPALGISASHRRRREGFALTDAGTDVTGALDHANYCIWCHNQGKDSCSKGLREKTGEFKKSAFGVTLAGCPLEEKISEMNLTAAGGLTVGSLAIAIVDNPMLAATGHRICNDCMKSCIFQKQDPVDIPQVETRLLKDTLALPWGFEIYALLSRWNPLNLTRPLPRAPSGKTVLVVGLGPAGFTLAHHLINDGHAVVAIDGLKIEPLDATVSGVGATGARTAFAPVRDFESLREPLGSRVMAGFGGVAEYGITVRWDKTFLKVVRLLLERRGEFRMFGGVRFGGTMTIESAFALGFDHIALCAGAGRPTIVGMANGLAPGVRQASDFLMALQLTGAAKTDSIANLQVRLPVAVIGGGLTAIDTATEALAYYPLQVEKFLSRYEALVADRGVAAVEAGWTPQEREVAAEFLEHARAIRAERAAAAKEGREARIVELLRGWGGATICYRRRLIDSPSYTLNHEEVAKALEEGIRFAEGLTPLKVEIDGFGHAAALTVGLDRARNNTDEEFATEQTLPAKTILVAAGTQPNTVLGREDPARVHINGKYFQAFNEAGEPVTPEPLTKPAEVQVLMSVGDDARAVSFFGDLHPSFAGNVVKAMSSAKQGYPVVSRMLAKTDARRTPEALFAQMDGELRATVHKVVRLTPTIVEVVVKAPMAARAFQPGQFYRLQNFETLAPSIDGSRLAMEGLALTGAWTDKDAGLLSTIVLEMGGSSDLCAQLQPGEPVILMGPTGHATEIPENETVLLIGGGLGNAVLFSIGQAMKAKGCRVIYFAGYKRGIDRYKVEEIERAADAIVWCCDEAPGFTPDRPGDLAFVGNIVEAIDAYGRGALGETPISLGDVDRIIAIGSDGMMNAVASARHGVLAAHLKPGHKGIGSINSPMQCMMKEICAQCLQTHKDPATGVESVVFSCFNQDQELDKVQFAGLRGRLTQNGVQEKLTRHWIDRSMHTLGLRGRQAAE